VEVVLVVVVIVVEVEVEMMVVVVATVVGYYLLGRNSRGAVAILVVV
jgi:hypothetical protein